MRCHGLAWLPWLVTSGLICIEMKIVFTFEPKLPEISLLRHQRERERERVCGWVGERERERERGSQPRFQISKFFLEKNRFESVIFTF